MSFHVGIFSGIFDISHLIDLYLEAVWAKSRCGMKKWTRLFTTLVAIIVAMTWALFPWQIAAGVSVIGLAIVFTLALAASRRKHRQPGPIRRRLIQSVPFVTWAPLIGVYVYFLYAMFAGWPSTPHNILGWIAETLVILMMSLFVLVPLVLIGIHPIPDILYWMLGHKPDRAYPSTAKPSEDDDSDEKSYHEKRWFDEMGKGLALGPNNIFLTKTFDD